MNCNRCEDSGYVFDTLFPCDECKLGSPIEHKHNQQELKRLEKRCRYLRKEIKEYEQRQKK